MMIEFQDFGKLRLEKYVLKEVGDDVRKFKKKHFRWEHGIDVISEHKEKAWCIIKNHKSMGLYLTSHIQFTCMEEKYDVENMIAVNVM